MSADSKRPTAEAVMAAVVRTLDRERPEWRLARVDDGRDGLPRDGREALAAITRRSPGGLLMSDRALHPEFVLSASDEELLRFAWARPGRRPPEAVSMARRLRQHARRILALERRASAPIGTALREAHEHGRLARFLDALPVDAPPWSAGERREVALAFAPRPSAARRVLLRFLDRSGIDPESAVGQELLLARASLEAFAADETGVCGRRPWCGRCELFARRLCAGVADAATLPADDAPVRRNGAPAGVAPAGSDRRLGRGAMLVRRARRRVAALDYRWRSLTRIAAPSRRGRGAKAAAERFAADVARIGTEVTALARRIERGLQALESIEDARSSAQRRTTWEGGWRLLSRLRSIDQARRELGGGRSARRPRDHGSGQPLAG